MNKLGAISKMAPKKMEIGKLNNENDKQFLDQTKIVWLL